MKKRDLICVTCPNGCPLEVMVEEGVLPRVSEVKGHLCEKGVKWAEQEMIHPVRTISSSILVIGGDFPLVSVRTDSPIPLQKIPDVMKAIKSVMKKAPVFIGDIVIEKPADTSCNIIATRHVQALQA